MANTTIHAALPHRSIRMADVIIFLALAVLVLTYIDVVGNNSHNAQLVVPCCGQDFWLSPFGCAVLLVVSSLLLRLRRPHVYPIVIVTAFFVLAFYSSIALQRWIDYSTLNKGYAIQQAFLPLYRPLSILVSLLLLITTIKNGVVVLKSKVELKNDVVSSWDFKLTRASALLLAFTNSITLLYEIGFAKGYDAAAGPVSDFDFYHWLSRLHLSITLGLIVTAVGLCLNKMRGLWFSAFGLVSVIAVYAWWYSKTKAYIANLEVTASVSHQNPHYTRLLFLGANLWDQFILVLTLSMLIWVVAAMLRIARRKAI
jgi:hypothetical protein